MVTRLRETALKQKKVEERTMEKMMESALKMNGYYFDFDTKVLTATKEFAEKAGDIDSPECAKFLALRNRFPRNMHYEVENGSYAQRWAEENAFNYSIKGEEQNLDWLNN